MAVDKMSEEIPWNSLLQDVEENTPYEIRIHLKPIYTKFKYHYTKKIPLESRFVKTCLLRFDVCLHRVWETLNTGYWKCVPMEYRYCYSFVSVLKALFLENLISIQVDNNEKIKMLKCAIRQLDKGILLGAPLPHASLYLTEVASRLNTSYVEIKSSSEHHGRVEINEQEICTSVFPQFLTILSYDKPSMETFYAKIFKPKVPALLKNCLNHWKARELWQDLDYLEKVAGSRTVPIEIGSRYTDQNWTQHLETFSDFVNLYVKKKAKDIGYLAQHNLFEQIPQLKEDFTVPDYCNFSDQENDDLPDINAWFGPGGTISPLHYDPKNNLLCQVFGYKRIILYSPQDSDYVYPYDTKMLFNTARVDPYKPDFEEYPHFQNAKGFMCYLRPGDMLFIPPKWWHHIVSLTPSFSVSFWWD